MRVSVEPGVVRLCKTGLHGGGTLGESRVWCVCRRSREDRPDCGRCRGCSLLDLELLADAVYQVRSPSNLCLVSLWSAWTWGDTQITVFLTMGQF